MAYRIILRKDTSTKWAKNNPVLLEGEPGYEIDSHMMKMGDGITHWNSLDYYIIGPTGAKGTSGTSGNSGTSGTSGDSGTSGTSGSSGDSGTSGSSGDTGTSGTSGSSGDTGTSGTSGSSGDSGTSGTSGLSGVPLGGTSGQMLTKIDSTDYNTQWVNPSAGGGSTPVRLTSQILSVSTWTLVSGYYTYTFSDVNITINSDLSVTPQNESYMTGYNAQVLPYIGVGAGFATFYAQFPPASNMVVDVVITTVN